MNRKSKSILPALMAALMAGSGLALAQGNDSEHMSRTPQQAAQERNSGRAPQARPPGREGNTMQAQRDERGAGPDHQFQRGGRLPPEYRGRQYVVDDWRGHHLNAPPRGYQWVQTGGDYVLVAIATGIIAQLLLNN